MKRPLAIYIVSPMSHFNCSENLEYALLIPIGVFQHFFSNYCRILESMEMCHNYGTKWVYRIQMIVINFIVKCFTDEIELTL